MGISRTENPQPNSKGNVKSLFDKTLQKTTLWLKELMEIGGFSNTHVSYIVLRAVLHALRDRLTIQEAVDLGAQLPMLIRGFYYEGWVPAKTPKKIRTQEEFVDIVQQHISNAKIDTSIDTSDVIRAVFTLLSKEITAGELDDVKGLLPKKIRALLEE